jgi:hypothetical protein
VPPDAVTLKKVVFPTVLGLGEALNEEIVGTPEREPTETVGMTPLGGSALALIHW